jgi:hypothetical protein
VVGETVLALHPTDKVVARLKGPFNLYLTMELRTNVRVQVRPGAKYRWLAEMSDLDMLEDFAAIMEPQLDAALVALLPELADRLTPMMTTTPRLFPYLMVPDRATFGLPQFDSRANGAVVSVDGWEVIEFNSFGSAVARVWPVVSNLLMTYGSQEISGSSRYGSRG